MSSPELITQLRTAEPQRRRRAPSAGVRPNGPVDTVVARMAVQYQERTRLGQPALFVRVYYDWVEGEAERMAALVNQPPRPPMVTVALPDQRLPAALLIWARSTDGGGWRAGLCYIYKTWHSRALVTTWAPAVRVSPHPTASYDQVPRIRLHGDPSQWPPLPPRYPGASQRWLAEHQHLAYGSAP